MTIPRMADFRDAVDRIVDVRDRTLIQVLYLSAARVSEVVTRVGKYDLEHLASWNYGSYMTCQLQDFRLGKTSDKTEKVLLLKMAVAKRKVKQKQTDDEGTRRVMFKYIALPTTLDYEPWTICLLKYMQLHGNLNFDLGRRTVGFIVHKHLHDLDKHIHTHSLRHYRISHLVEYYAFDPYDISSYAGWTVRTTLGSMGLGGSGQLDTHLHLAWRRYFPKLMVPLPED